MSYLRVSTVRQGQSGLGLEAQREAVARYVHSHSGVLVHEFVEVESGNQRDRPVLRQAVSACKPANAILVIAKLDRLARNVAFVSSLIEARTEFVAVDAPYANKLMIHILAAFAEHEREQIAARTKSALAAAKARGVRLGANGARLATERRAAALIFAEGQRTTFEALAAAGLTLRQMARRLNEADSTTRAGREWSPTTVRRVLLRLKATSVLQTAAPDRPGAPQRHPAGGTNLSLADLGTAS